MSYRAMESIFSVIFDKAEPQLHLLWIQLKNQLGLPHIVTPQAFRIVSEFADSELAALVLTGGTSQNPGLPLTENQKKRLQDFNDKEKKQRAAKSTDASAGPPSTARQAPIAARLSSTMSSWATICRSWQAGKCERGISCHFQHDGCDLDKKLCFICKSSEHGSKECKCPGGGLDPQKDKHWEEYRARKAKALEDNPFAKVKSGDKGKGATSPKGKGKGKSRSKGKGK